MATALTRERVLGYRVAVQHLERPAGEGVLPAGVRDSPPGRTAAVALRVRGADPDGLVLLHSLRAAPHLHRAEDVAVLNAALRGLEAADLAKEHIGPFVRELVDLGLGWARDHIADAMRQVCADGRPRTKSELSTEVSELVDARLRPWCPGCASAHVQDTLFRYATLPAGLALAVGPGTVHYVRSGDPPAADPVASQTILLRRFLRLCGPCRPEHLARWLALAPSAARRLWRRLGDALVPVEVDGRTGWVHQEDLEELRRARPATGVLLLPPADPLTELADRELLLPDRTRRAAVWRPLGNPGVLLVRGEIAGTYRQRAAAITIHPFETLTAADRRHAESLGVDVSFAGQPG